jgi:hypothetical protein
VVAAQLRAVRTQAATAAMPAAADGPTLLIRPSLAGGHVTAVYHVEDMRMEVVVSFPRAYPLRPCEVAASGGGGGGGGASRGNVMGVGEGLWRKWVLSMTAVVASQVRS